MFKVGRDGPSPASVGGGDFWEGFEGLPKVSFHATAAHAGTWLVAPRRGQQVPGSGPKRESTLWGLAASSVELGSTNITIMAIQRGGLRPSRRLALVCVAGLV